MKNRKDLTMYSLAKQRGMTFWSLFFVLSVVLFFAYIGIRLVPVYLANENVKNAAELALNNENLLTINRAGVIRKMKNQLYLDGSAKVVDFTGKELILRRSNSEFHVQTKYTQEIPLFLNISILVSFDNVASRRIN